MNIRRTVAAAITAAAVMLSMTACGKNEQSIVNGGAGNVQSDGEKKPSAFDNIPDFTMTDAKAFKYNYDTDLGGMVITDYLRESPKVWIPDTLEGEPVVGVNFVDLDKQLTELILPVSVTKIWYGSFEKCEKLNITYKGEIYDHEHIDDLYIAVGCLSELASAYDVIAGKLTKELNNYIATYTNYGGRYELQDSIMAEISISNGEASVKMNGYNDTGVTDKCGTFESVIKENFSFKGNGKAVIYTNSHGKAYAAIYSGNADAVFGTYSCTDDGKIIPSFSWRSENEPGVTPDGHIVGTYPKVDGSGTAHNLQPFN